MRWIAVAVSLALIAVALSSCSLPFYLQAASGQIKLLRAREPIAEVIADPGTGAELRQRLEQVGRVRSFAIDELQLPDNGSYETYADLGRNYVVWNVVAASEFSTSPQRWCFPFAGCVAYRGFFERAKAEAFQSQLDEQGLDTWSGGASAYSTLGFFADPVLNTMLDAGSEEVVAVLIHELAHQRLYVKDDSELSEAFASTVEEYGTRTWLEREGDSAGLERYEQRLRARAVFAELIARQQARLSEIFARSISAEEMRAAKSAAYAELVSDYEAERDAGRMPAGYDGWFAQDLNNATLAAVATYRRWVPALRYRLAEGGLEAFYDDVGALAELDAEQRSQTLESWDAAARASAAQR
jgi:predicted aminopeptidase